MTKLLGLREDLRFLEAPCFVPLFEPYGDFLKWGYLQIMHFIDTFHYKPTIVGYPHLWKPPWPISIISSFQDLERLCAKALVREASLTAFANALLLRRVSGSGTPTEFSQV